MWISFVSHYYYSFLLSLWQKHTFTSNRAILKIHNIARCPFVAYLYLTATDTEHLDSQIHGSLLIRRVLKRQPPYLTPPLTPPSPIPFKPVYFAALHTRIPHVASPRPDLYTVHLSQAVPHSSAHIGEPLALSVSISLTLRAQA